jgi:hypothetical protein
MFRLVQLTSKGYQDMTHDLEVNGEVVEMTVNKAIERNVLSALGRPPRYKFTDVKPTMPSTVRVNVFVTQGDLFKTSKISDSFYLKVNEKGDIIGGDPINPKYK